jgi:glycosyltransferase involved in cell wall biosynthesis
MGKSNMCVPEPDLFLSDRPRVSVIVPTKNRREALEETIRTLLMQTFMTDELIIVDQSQTKSLLQTSSLSLKYIHNPEITGASQA